MKMKSVFFSVLFILSCLLLSAQSKDENQKHVDEVVKLLDHHCEVIGISYKKIYTNSLNEKSSNSRKSLSLLLWLTSHLDGETADLHFTVLENVSNRLGGEKMLASFTRESVVTRKLHLKAFREKAILTNLAKLLANNIKKKQATVF